MWHQWGGGGGDTSSYNLLVTCFATGLTYTASDVFREAFLPILQLRTLTLRGLSHIPRPHRIPPHIDLAPMSVSFLFPSRKKAEGRVVTWEASRDNRGQS